MNDLLGGQVNMQFAGISSAKQHVEAADCAPWRSPVSGAGRYAGRPDL